jgi:HAD superfamily hydrolase (TIGR01490 family)
METTTLKGTESDISIAFFDLDHTLTGAVSGTALAQRALKKGLMSTSRLIHALWLSASHRIGLKDPSKAVYEMAGWVKGVSEPDFNNLCLEVFNEVVKPAFFKEAYDEIKLQKESDAKTVILSSSLSPICREVAACLEMDDIICSELEVSDGVLTGRSVGRLCFGDEKLNRLIEYCEKNNTTPSSCSYYADAHADLPALSIVGNPVCINPEKKLKRIAVKNGWKICKWQKRLL